MASRDLACLRHYASECFYTFAALSHNHPPVTGSSREPQSRPLIYTAAQIGYVSDFNFSLSLLCIQDLVSVFSVPFLIATGSLTTGCLFVFSSIQAINWHWGLVLNLLLSEHLLLHLHLQIPITKRADGLNMKTLSQVSEEMLQLKRTYDANVPL